MQDYWTTEFGLCPCSKDEISGTAARYDERIAPEHELENDGDSNALTYRHVLVLVDHFGLRFKVCAHLLERIVSEKSSVKNHV